MSFDAEMHLSAYEYLLPKELIAQEPFRERDKSRLLVMDRSGGTTAHRQFSDIVDHLRPGDCLVINRTRVVPVRLFGKKETGGKVEVLFLDPRALAPGGSCRVLVKPFLAPGKTIFFPDGLSAVVEGRTPEGETLLRLAGSAPGEVLERHGRMPLPPYIKRRDEDATHHSMDRERYQTVYAAEKGSIAAPTAGLHFTGDVLRRLREKGADIAEIVLHVGWGTFRPITAPNIAEHTMLPERYEIDETASAALRRCTQNGGRVVAVGTTSVRALESAAARVPSFDRRKDDALGPIAGETSIFIHPGHVFKVVDAMVTNFHLPHSTPLMMVSAFAGRERILAVYDEAVRKKYRFFSYGDAMMIL